MKKKFASLLLALALCVSCLSACAGAASNEPEREPWRPPVLSNAASDDPEPAASTDQTKNDPEPVETETRELEETVNPEEPTVENTRADLDPLSVQGVARLGDLVGNNIMSLFYDEIDKYIVVDTESEHNPYDLIWRYGMKPDEYTINPKTGKQERVPFYKQIDEVNDPEWDALYRSYVAACDWSLVFDAEYYKKVFPMLAKLYHENDALLLEHFQTQGVHEGRQANARFNVAAYMANCDKALLDAFGDNYECYYFYWMLNQDTQSKISTVNRSNAYPRWLTLELSIQQSREFDSVNGYRERAGVEPVELDPEMVAFANYRAWNDAEYNVYAHDWATDPATVHDVNDCMWRISSEHVGENTVKWYSKSNTQGCKFFSVHYAGSKDHYTAMVSEKYEYFGCSNPYWSDNPDNPRAENDNTGYACQFDMFTEVQPHTPYELD